MRAFDWRPIPGYVGYYEVSRCGAVRSLTVLRNHGGYRPRVLPGRVLKQYVHDKYPTVTIYGADGKPNKQRVHVLVAIAFIPNPDGLPFVLHADDVKKNNHADNLRWGTCADNQKDKYDNGNAGRVLSADDARCIKLMLAETYRGGQRRAPGSLKKIADLFGVSKVMVLNIDRGRMWRDA